MGGRIGSSCTPSWSIYACDNLDFRNGSVARPQIINDGDLIIGNSLGNPNVTTLASTGATVVITNGPGTIDLDIAIATESQIGGLEIATTEETLASTDDAKIVTPDKLGDHLAYSKFTGFVEFTGAGSYYTVSGTDFTLDRPGWGFIKGRKVEWLGGQTLSSLSAGDEHYIYIDDTGTIGSSTFADQSLYEDYIILFEVLVDSDTPSNVIVVKENHPYSSPTDLSVYLHNTIGVVISNRNNGANIIIGANPDEISISGTDYLEDHGLETTIPDSAGASEIFNFMYKNAGGKWVLYDSTVVFPSVYNNTGTVTALGVGKYGVFSLFASKDDIESAIPKYFSIINNAQYNNLSLANTAISNGSIQLSDNELDGLELARLGYVIYEESSGSIVQVIIDKATARGNTTSVISSTAIASLVTVVTTNFNYWLTASETNLQAVADKLDDVGAGITPEHGVLVAGANYLPEALAVGATGTVLIGNTGADPSFSATPSVTSITISNAPSNATDGVNKSYVDSISSGFDHKDTTVATTTANLNATYDNGISGVGATLTNNGALAAFSIDGQTPTTGQRVLIKDQTNAFENGIYTVTTEGSGAVAWVLTRATDYDEVAEMDNGSLVPVKNGTQYPNTTWMQVTTVTTIGTDAVDYNKYQGTPISTIENSVLIGDVYDGIKSQALTNGQLLIGSTGAAPVAALLTSSDSSINISIGAGSINLTTTTEQIVAVTLLDDTDSPYAALATDYHLSCDVSVGALTIQLPNAPTTGTIYSVKDATGSAATNNITVTTVGGAVNIDGATSFVMNTNYQAARFVFNGSIWEII